MDSSAWYVLIPVVAIGGGIVAAIFYQYFATKRKIAETEGSPELREALRVSNETNAELVARLGAIDARLGTIEKTLNDVA
ncbi:hypothetical protein BJ978_000861 [Agromyces terreus]|uniref:Uncharacterized protein n=1 Tax=Agromyces terreus TaxID=424795 RepID=A0A9X2GW82_9MICO|nr:hypothetical protein [Agromyces terreus]MCP2370185.1 hypothetical protein [Agromyces terreus]